MSKPKGGVTVLRLYTARHIDTVLGRCGGYMEEVGHRYGLPAACLRAVIRREMGETDILDPVADGFVRFYWFRWRLRKAIGLRDARPRLRFGPFGKRDSSTGWGQIFAYVAINAANYAVDHALADYASLGLPADHRMSPKDPEDLYFMWHELHRNWRVNLTLSALNLLSAAEEENGHTDFSRYTPEEYQLAFTRYNANTRRITEYGRIVYRLYLQELEAQQQGG